MNAGQTFLLRWNYYARKDRNTLQIRWRANSLWQLP
jgi:hypothetical protein